MKNYLVSLLAGLTLMASATSQAADARVSGSWAGQAELSTTWDSATSATDLFISFFDAGNQLDLELSFTYPNGQVVNQAMTFDVSGSSVSYNGTVVGEVDQNRLVVSNAIVGGDNYSLIFQKNSDGSASFVDEYCYSGYQEKTCESLTAELSATGRSTISKIKGKAQR